MNKNIYILIIMIAVIYFSLSFTMKSKIINIVNRLPRAGNWGKRPVSGITDITVHHSASPSSQTAYDFARYHVNSKGWPGIGYHFVIEKDGTIHQTNDLESLSYHNGYNNSKAIGVCMSGNFENTPPDQRQIESLIWLVKYLKKKVPSVFRLVGHKEYAGATACPGRYVNMNTLRAKTNLQPFANIYAKSIINNEYYLPSEADN